MIQGDSIPILSCNQAAHGGQQVNVVCLRVGCKYSPAQCQRCTFELHKDCINFSKQLEDIPKLIEPDQQLTSQLLFIQQKINNLFKELMGSIQQQLQPISTYLDNPNLSNLNELGTYFRKEPSATVKNLVVQKLQQLNLVFEEFIKILYIQPETDHVNPPYVSKSKQISVNVKPIDLRQEQIQKIATSSQIQLKESIIVSKSLQPIQKVYSQGIQLTKSQESEQSHQIPNVPQSLGETAQVFHFGTIQPQYQNQQTTHSQFQRHLQHSNKYIFLGQTVKDIPYQMVYQQQPQQFLPPTQNLQSQIYPPLPIGPSNQQEISEAIVSHLAIGNQLFGKRQYMEALEYYEKVIDSDARNKTIWLNKGNQLFELQEYTIAIYYYEKATYIDKMNQKIWLEKGRQLFEYKLYDFALMYLDNSMKYNIEATVIILENYSNLSIQNLVKRLHNLSQITEARKYAEKIISYQYSIDKARFYLNCQFVTW